MSILDRLSPPDPKSRLRNFGDAYLFVLSALFRDVHLNDINLPQRESPKIFIVTWWIAT